MKKNIKILVFSIIFAIIMPIISHAINTSSANKEVFFTSDKLEASPGDTITLIVDLSKIDYENFEFTLSSNKSLGDLTTNDDSMDMELTNDKLKIISSKSDIDMQKVELYYKIPDDISVGSSIVLNGTIRNIESNNEKDDLDNSIENDNLKSEQASITISITEAKSDKDENDKNNSDKKDENNTDKKDENNIAQPEANDKNSSEFDKNSQGENNSVKNNASILTQSTSSKSMITQIASKGISSSISSVSEDKETVSYNGSSNNYLSSLTVDGYDLSTTFTKTNTTYFVNINSDVSSINITAVPEESSAKVTVYGNQNIESSKSKILISVTAENGSVRIYRLYVTK